MQLLKGGLQSLPKLDHSPERHTGYSPASVQILGLTLVLLPEAGSLIVEIHRIQSWLAVAGKHELQWWQDRHRENLA